MIEAERLTKRYGELIAVDNLSFQIDKGEICGFLGPNGAGKTSTMRMLTGFMPPTSGKGRVAGFDLFTHPMEVKKRIGYLPESTPLYTETRVAEYLDFVAEIKGLRGAARRKAVADVMEKTMISHRQRSLIGSLSKGLKQRVGLAQALLGDPEVLVLDEPTIGLDPKQIREIRALIKDLAGRRTVILSSHILSEIQMICSRVLIINSGRLIASDTIDRLSGRGERRISAVIDGPAGEVAEALRRLPGVTGVDVSESGPGSARYAIGVAQDENPRKELVRLVAEKDWDLVEMSGAAESLEDVYIRLISDRETGQPWKEAEGS